jgi:hypothetical protein
VSASDLACALFFERINLLGQATSLWPCLKGFTAVEYFFTVIEFAHGVAKLFGQAGLVLGFALVCRTNFGVQFVLPFLTLCSLGESWQANLR